MATHNGVDSFGKSTPMANTLHQSAVHTVFAPKYRQALILPNLREPLQRYMTGMVRGMEHLPMAIYAMPDHVHLLMAISMNMEPRKIMQVLKAETSKWINEQGLLQRKFEWQRGYGWFHVSACGIDAVADYIRHQPEHHRKTRFLTEYTGLLNENGIACEPRYLFTDPE
ncbi:MAG: IS200/IS605 family transposase [Chitinophagaceae bacterium]|nr:MAG: IS200/IS605 family transposase [Chitinophagaceae bacterium]